MLVYRTDDHTVDCRILVDRLVDRIDALKNPAHDELTSVFIDFGEIESAIADCLFPDHDGIDPLASALRAAGIQSAHALITSWHQQTDLRDRSIEAFRQRLRALAQQQLPRTVSLRVSEGYAYYALRPETYAVAAEQWMRDERPASAVCIGIRSIGCSLSSVIAAAVERAGFPVTSYTVRPRGHPFDRRVVLDDSLAARLGAAHAAAHFLVADEGPGLSGSSFASVAHALRRLGIPTDRIILFPSSNPDGSAFRSETARAIWNQHRRCSVSAREARCSIDDVTGESGGVDVSAGRWRELLRPTAIAPPAVQPQHEVIKRWLPESSTIVRFAGLGRYGEAKMRRAQALADAGLGPPPLRLKDGYLWLPFIAASAWGDACEETIDALANHCAGLTRSFPAGRSPSIDTLFNMVVTNLHEGSGGHIAPSDLERYRAALDAAPCAAIDGRMLPHEWLRTNGTFLKVDALDHHQDHFFPGTQDAGWDLAAAAFEFDLDDGGRQRLVERYVEGSGDADVVWRMAFYDIAYPAFRLGYCVLAAQSLG